MTISWNELLIKYDANEVVRIKYYEFSTDIFQADV